MMIALKNVGVLIICNHYLLLIILERGIVMPAEKGNKYALGNKGGGRPSAYEDSFAKLAYKICLLGATDEDLADCFEVSETTINNWKKEHKEFNLALKRGKLPADADVALSLNKRAKGFKCKEVTKEPNENGKLVIVKEVTKEVPPDTGACMAWLKNRRSKNWRDKQEVQVDSHNVNENIASLADLINNPVKDREIPDDD